MNFDRTSQGRARSVSLTTLSLIALVVCNGFAAPFTLAQQRRSSGAAKSKSVAASSEDVASLLRQAAELLQAGNSTKRCRLFVVRLRLRRRMRTRITFSA
jgi:hypothetical protein